MTRRLYKRLTVQAVKQLAKQPGRHPDGDGLYLQVSDSGAASWILRYMTDGRERALGLGALRHVTLAEARQLAEAARRQRRDGIDPIEARQAQQRERLAARRAAPSLSFKAAAEAYIATHRAGWRSREHAHQWAASLARHAYPVLGERPVAAVDTPGVMQALQPLWTQRPETASRLRSRIESVLDWATTAGHRPPGENPARWRGHLENLLPKPSRAKVVARQARGRGEHHAALPHAEIAALVADLRRQDSVAALALEFVILTASRSGEVLGATWAEIDLGARLWTVPAARIKGGREHRVPLVPAAAAILARMQDFRDGSGLVFPGATPGRPLGHTTLRKVLQRLGRGGVTVHGFRSTFRDWAAECTEAPSGVAEMALAHNVGAEVERAYRRSDLVERRRQLAESWADYCGRPPAAPAVAAA